MKTFYKLLGAGLIAATTNNFVWFALTFFTYLQTKSVISTGLVAGVYLTATAVSGFWLGSIVDHNKKKNVLLGSSTFSLFCYLVGLLFILVNPKSSFTHLESPALWALIIILMLGTIAGNLYTITIPTLVTKLVPENKRDKANGLFGTVVGISFALTSVASGMVLGFLGMTAVMLVAAFATLIVIIYLIFVDIPEKKLIHAEHPDMQKGMDIKGTIKIVLAIPGLFALIIFNTFNNFLGGVFMALMDAYGLTLVSVQIWGLMFGFLSLGFIAGGLIVAKKGLGKNPLKTMFTCMLVMWITAAIFTIQASIILLAVGILIWITLVPVIEASEQTIFQKVVPPERQGRVFGFSQSVEQIASPLTAFLMGPITQLIFIPFMTTGAGVDLIGDWFGTGPGRGIALVFVLSGIIGIIVTVIAIKSRYYRLLSNRYLKG